MSLTPVPQLWWWTASATGWRGTELREAIGLVCDGGTVTFDTAGVFATPQTITLTSGELLIGKNVTITGTGAANLTVSGSNVTRVFDVDPTWTVAISG